MTNSTLVALGQSFVLYVKFEPDLKCSCKYPPKPRPEIFNLIVFAYNSLNNKRCPVGAGAELKAGVK